MSRRCVRRLRGEEGTSLVIALAFLGLLGAAIASMLMTTFASFKTTQSVRGGQSRLYGADAGIDLGIQTLRANTSYCPEVSTGTQTLPAQTINGKTLTVTCQTLSGSAGGQSTGLTTYALIATGYPDPDSTSAPNMDDGIKVHGSGTAGSNPMIINGDVFNAGNFTLQNYPPREQINGNVHQYNDAPKIYCSGDRTTFLISGTPIVTGTWSCDLAANFAVPDPTPTLVVPTATAPAPVTVGTCTILFPGRYTSKYDFNKDKRYYLASGVYYWDNVGETVLEGEIFGGAPGPNETQKITTTTPCANDATANSYNAGSATGYGVEIVLGNNSKIKVNDEIKDHMEFFSRQGGAGEGTQGVSFYAPRTSGTNYTRWKADHSLAISGTKPTLVIHGLWYTPNAEVKDARALLNTDAGNASLFMAGVVAQQIEIDFDSASIGSTMAAAPATTSASPRTVVVTATASASGEASVTETAVVVFGTSSTTPPTVSSWRKN